MFLEEIIEIGDVKLGDLGLPIGSCRAVLLGGFVIVTIRL